MSLNIFGSQFKLAWWLTFLALSIVELTPFHSEGVPPRIFYTWKLFKCFLFFAVGWETPLTFWRTGSLTNGLLLACASASIVEALQGLVVGHSFSFVELLAKFALICGGFMVGLAARHDEGFGVRGFHVDLVPTRKL